MRSGCAAPVVQQFACPMRAGAHAKTAVYLARRFVWEIAMSQVRVRTGAGKKLLYNGDQEGGRNGAIGPMRRRYPMRNAITLCRSAAMLAAVAINAAGCGEPSAGSTNAAKPFAWPASLAPLGDGYPNPGDACRRLGESATTSGYLDHTATLVGCPGSSDSANAQAIVRGRHARVVGVADGVTLISVPGE
jgi:hypothetical protein